MIGWIKLFNKLSLWLMNKLAEEIQIDIDSDLILMDYYDSEVKIYNVSYDAISLDIIFDNILTLEQELDIRRMIGETEDRYKVFLNVMTWSREDYENSHFKANTEDK